MTDGFFPPDVRIRFNGKAEDGWSALGEARQLLFKALNMQLAGYPTPINLTRPLMNGGEVNVFLIGNQKIITITPPIFIPIEVKLAEEIKPLEFFGMLSGWVRDAHLVGPTGKKKLTSWRPTLFDVVAYKLKNDWQDSLRLGVEDPDTLIPEHANIRASMYSGAMKTWVQAILGMGIIDDKISANYLNGAIPDPTKRPIVCKYSPTWSTTHGIVKTGPKNHWLVEISHTGGILAMPLPILFSTTDPGYKQSIQASGDVGTLAILNEFGGLPSGETFPTDPTELAAHIADHKILRLAVASDLDPFYNGNAYSGDYGWAFSPDGTEIHNTCWTYRNADGSLPYTTGLIALYGEHWMMKLNLSPHNISQLANHLPIGTGSLEMTQVHAGQVDHEAFTNFFRATGPTTPHQQCSVGLVSSDLTIRQKRTLFNTPGDAGYNINDHTYAVNENWGATLLVFFDYKGGIQRLKWVPEKTWSKGRFTFQVIVPVDTTGDPVGTEAAPFYHIGTDFSATWSPSGFTGAPLEERQINGVYTIESDNSSGFYDDLYTSKEELRPSYGNFVFDVDGNLISKVYIGPPNDIPFAADQAADYGSIVPPTGAAAGSFQYLTQYIAFVPYGCREGFMIAEQTANNLYDPAVFFEPFPHYTVRQLGYYAGPGGVTFDNHPLGPQSYFPAIFNVRASPAFLPQGGYNIIHSATIDAGPSKQYLVDDGYHYIIDGSNVILFPIGYVELRTMAYSGLPVGMLDVVTHPHQANWIGSV